MTEIKGPRLNEWVQSLQDDVPGFLLRIECNPTLTRTLQDALGFNYVDDTGMECIGVLHGEIKPNNIFMRDGRPRLLDFMMIDLQEFRSTPIEVLNEMEFSTMLFGTPNYMAPEQEQRGVVTRKSHIYALGATLKDIFKGSTSADWMAVDRDNK